MTTARTAKQQAFARASAVAAHLVPKPCDAQTQLPSGHRFLEGLYSPVSEEVQHSGMLEVVFGAIPPSLSGVFLRNGNVC